MVTQEEREERMLSHIVYLADKAIENGLVAKSDKNGNPYLFMKIAKNEEWARNEIFYPTSITAFRNKNGFTFSVWYSKENGARSCAKFLLLQDKGLCLLNGKAGGAKSLGNVFAESFGVMEFSRLPTYWDRVVEAAGLSPAAS